MSKKTFLLILIGAVFSGCASAPKISQQDISRAEAQQWLQQYCAKTSTQELQGELVMKSTTKEFKGQFPAQIRYEKSGHFAMEVTHILGGTVLRLTGNAQGMEMLVPSKPQYNRKNITQYMGIELPLLLQLLHGDLPCPAGKSTLQVEKNKIISHLRPWTWVYERAEESGVPVLIRLAREAQTAGQPPLEISLQIDEWNQPEHYAEKVRLTTSEGELKWSWRSRELQ